ncbi:Aspartate/glutamate leucyltransferase [Sinobacterium norvegicum]|uniref:Aspartate/glutamate leucyltransferase n=1 Tax=Sinobacterium norvegicum TaxID=1641715 RepID=A0ABN8ECY1_9GAMM|nr:arginyltransferase [Sinobacterium norvegicum]CAH0990321.1 Aspartate/glutamate leucyltransferase [Sinobacterium norvegicum]
MADLKVYATHPHNCSYLDGQQAVTLFVDPSAEVDKHLYSKLSDIGFRRSGSHIYRPHCDSCTACLAARLDVNRFSPSRSQRRVINKNKDLSCEIIDDISSDEFYHLYESYINQKHSDGDMFPPSREQYESFLSSQWGITQYLCFRDTENHLMAVAVVDQMNNGLAAVYTFYQVAAQERSLGTYAVLRQIDLAKQLQLRYIYLGYWIEHCDKMSYKSKFQPLEVLKEGEWCELIGISG